MPLASPVLFSGRFSERPPPADRQSRASPNVAVVVTRRNSVPRWLHRRIVPISHATSRWSTTASAGSTKRSTRAGGQPRKKCRTVFRCAMPHFYPLGDATSTVSQHWQSQWHTPFGPFSSVPPADGGDCKEQGGEADDACRQEGLKLIVDDAEYDHRKIKP